MAMAMLRSKMLVPTAVQGPGKICENLNFSRVWEQFYWTARKLKRELPSAQVYKGCNFHIKSTFSAKDKKKGIRSPVNFVVEKTISYLSSQQDGHSKFYLVRECGKIYKKESLQTVKNIGIKLLLQLLALRNKQFVRL